MPDFAGVWPAHKAADRLSSSLASIFEEGQPAEQRELTPAQRQLLTSELAALVSSMAKLGVIGAA